MKSNIKVSLVTLTLVIMVFSIAFNIIYSGNAVAEQTDWERAYNELKDYYLQDMQINKVTNELYKVAGYLVGIGFTDGNIWIIDDYVALDVADEAKLAGNNIVKAYQQSEEKVLSQKVVFNSEQYFVVLDANGNYIVYPRSNLAYEQMFISWDDTDPLAIAIYGENSAN